MLTKILRIVISVLACALMALLTAADEPSARTVTYQGITLEPGDVVEFHGGVFTKGSLLTYGHSALYLGLDPSTDQPTFLDFSVTKGGLSELVFGTPRTFYGRIMPEQEFLRYNTQSHDSFDVYRLHDQSQLDEHKLLVSAKRLAARETYGPLGKVCSSGVATVLSEAAGIQLAASTPDALASDKQLGRHPGLIGKSINVGVALRDAERRTGNRLIKGVWQGVVYQPGDKPYDVVMTITSAISGRTEYSSLNCGGSLAGERKDDGSYAFRERITHGRATVENGGCIDGQILIQQTEANTLSWSWTGSWQGKVYTATAALKRQ